MSEEDLLITYSYYAILNQPRSLLLLRLRFVQTFDMLRTGLKHVQISLPRQKQVKKFCVSDLRFVHSISLIPYLKIV